MSVDFGKRRILINCASGVVQNAVNVLVFVWVHQYLVKRISPEEYSLYPVVTALLVFMPVLTTVLTAGLGRYIAEAHAQGDERKVTEIVSTMFPLLLGIAITLLALGGVLANLIDRVLTIAPDRVGDARLMLSVLVLSIAIRLPLAPFGVGLYVTQRFLLLNSLATGTVVLRSVLLFVLLRGVSSRVIWLVIATVTAEVLELLVTVAISRRVLPVLTFQWCKIRWQLFHTLTAFGFWNTVSLLAYLIRKSSDPLILNKLGTAQNVASFHLGNLADNHIEVTEQKATESLQPAMIALHATGQRVRLQNFYLRGGRYALWGVLFVATPLMVYRKELWSLYLGSAYGMYADASTVMALLMLRYWISYPNVMIYKVAHATGNLKPLSIRFILAAISNVLLTLYLVGVWNMGAVGSALGTLVVATVWEPIIWRFSLRLVGVSFRHWFRETIWPGVLPGAVTAVSGLLLKLLTPPSGWLELGVLVACCCGVYVWTLLAFCLTADEGQALLRILGRMRALVASTARTVGAA